MTNLLSNDVNRFDRGVPNLPYLIIAPLQAVAATAVMSLYLGISALLVPVGILILVPIQGQPVSVLTVSQYYRISNFDLIQEYFAIFLYFVIALFCCV